MESHLFEVVHDFETHNNYNECGNLSLEHHGLVSNNLKDCEQGIEDDEGHFENSELCHEIPDENKTVSKVFESICFDDDQNCLNQGKDKIDYTKESRCKGPIWIFSKVEDFAAIWVIKTLFIFL